MTNRSCAIILVIFQFLLNQINWIQAGRGEVYGDEEGEEGQKNYEPEEEDKIVPHRTFLNTVEIVVICVFAVLIVFFLIGLAIYLFIFGCEVAPQLRRPDKDYIKIQRERERKIGELWLHNQSQTDHLERVNDDQGIILP